LYQPPLCSFEGKRGAPLTFIPQSQGKLISLNITLGGFVKRQQRITP